MLTRYNRNKHKALSERGKRMAAARWKADRERRDAEMPERIRELEEIAIDNLPRQCGDALGCLQWSDFRTGKVRRWVVRVGDRRDRVTVEGPGKAASASHGWTWLMRCLRGHLCRYGGRKAES